MAPLSICMIPLEERQHNFHFKSYPLSLRQLFMILEAGTTGMDILSACLAGKNREDLYRVAGCSRISGALKRELLRQYGPNFDFIFEQEVGWWLFFDAEPLKCGFRRKGATAQRSVSLLVIAVTCTCPSSNYRRTCLQS